ncbi:hypothetical protein DFJ77DRAFT_484481 [Powellomyces hirtus]|nr:hypothetical protein DFJ77DRAFT_484481 [Powellomyces hirtus]
MHVVVIGAGPSGLVTAKTLLDTNSNPLFAARPDVRVSILEQEPALGGTFKYRAYQNAELVSSKQLTAFSDFRFPPDQPDHVSVPDYIAYLERYAAKHNLGQLIHFGTKVTAIEKHSAPGDQHIIHYMIGDVTHSIACDAIAMCSGLHVTPNMPDVPGLANVKGEVLHSSQYKARNQLAGRNVLVLGCGETAMDLAYEAVQVAKRVVLSHRNGFLSFPKAFRDFVVFGYRLDGALPLDTLISNLFENAYVHPRVRSTRFRWHFSDQFVRLAMLFLTGTSIGCSQWVAPPHHVGRAWNFLNKSTKAMPYINKPFKRWYTWQWLAHYDDDLPAEHQDKEIHVCPWVDHIDETGQVHFKEDDSASSRLAQSSPPFRPDLVVCATGYKQETLFRDDETFPRLREILTDASQPSIAFIGLVRPNVGAIPPIAEMQAMWWTLVLQGKLDPKSLDAADTHYKLLPTASGRISYGVDHSAYTYQLAVDMKAAPSLLQGDLLRTPRLLAAYCLCAAFTPLFRLVGPFRWDGAAEIVTGELWETVARRGVLGNLFMTVLPMLVYATVNLGMCTLELAFWAWPIRVGPASIRIAPDSADSATRMQARCMEP